MTPPASETALMGVMPPGRLTSMRYIVNVCCDHYGVSAEDIRSHRRGENVHVARQAVMYLAAEVTRITLAKIGHFLNRDHKTVLSGIKKFRAKLESGDVELPVDVEGLRREVRAIESRSDTPEAMTDALQAAIAHMCERLVKLLKNDPLRGIRLLAELLEKADG